MNGFVLRKLHVYISLNNVLAVNYK